MAGLGATPFSTGNIGTNAGLLYSTVFDMTNAGLQDFIFDYQKTGLSNVNTVFIDNSRNPSAAFLQFPLTGYAVTCDPYTIMMAPLILSSGNINGTILTGGRVPIPVQFIKQAFQPFKQASVHPTEAAVPVWTELTGTTSATIGVWTQVLGPNPSRTQLIVSPAAANTGALGYRFNAPMANGGPYQLPAGVPYQGYGEQNGQSGLWLAGSVASLGYIVQCLDNGGSSSGGGSGPFVPYSTQYFVADDGAVIATPAGAVQLMAEIYSAGGQNSGQGGVYVKKTWTAASLGASVTLAIKAASALTCSVTPISGIAALSARNGSDFTSTANTVGAGYDLKSNGGGANFGGGGGGGCGGPNGAGGQGGSVSGGLSGGGLAGRGGGSNQAGFDYGGGAGNNVHTNSSPLVQLSWS